MTTAAQCLAPGFAGLLMHPSDGVSGAARKLAVSIAEVSKPAAALMVGFADRFATLSLDEQQELHGRTFDLKPACTPFLSVHLFGEESFKRAEFMAGLAEAYVRADFDPGNEVPDHLAVVLRFAPHFSSEEWTELGQYCLPSALRAMRANLNSSTNPYAQLVEAISHLLGTDFPEILKEKPCSTSSFSEPSHTLPSSHSSPGPCGGCGLMPSVTPPFPPSSSKDAN